MSSPFGIPTPHTAAEIADLKSTFERLRKDVSNIPLHHLSPTQHVALHSVSLALRLIATIEERDALLVEWVFAQENPSRNRGDLTDRTRAVVGDSQLAGYGEPCEGRR